MPPACLFDELQLLTSCTDLPWSPLSSPPDLYIKDFLAKPTACSTDSLSEAIYRRYSYDVGTIAKLESPAISEESSEYKDCAGAPYGDEEHEYSDATVPQDSLSARCTSRENLLSPVAPEKGPHLTITLAYPHETCNADLCNADVNEQDDADCHEMCERHSARSDKSQEHTIPTPRVSSVSPTPPVVSVDLYLRPHSPDTQPVPPVHTSYSNYTPGPTPITPSTLPSEVPRPTLPQHDRNRRRSRTLSASPLPNPAESSEEHSKQTESFLNSYPPIQHLYLPLHSSSLSYRPPLLQSQYDPRGEAKSRNVPASQARNKTHEETFRQVLQRHRECGRPLRLGLSWL